MTTEQATHSDVTKVADYLYEVTCYDYDETKMTEQADYLAKLIRSLAHSPGGCSAAHVGDYYGRNLDLFYGDIAEFIMRVHAHTMGDGAVHAFADAVEKSVKETGDYDQRNAAAHLQFVSDEDKARFAKYGIVAVAGYHWAIKGQNSANEEKLVGHERYITSYPGQSLIDAGVTVVGHSDYPISPIMSAPFVFYMGSTRQLPSSENTDVLGPQERISGEDLLKTLTSNVAYMWGEEDRMGTLEAGKLANMAVPAVDLLHDDLDTIAHSIEDKNVATIVDGEVVFESEPKEMTDAEFEELLSQLSSLYDSWSEAEAALSILKYSNLHYIGQPETS